MKAELIEDIRNLDFVNGSKEDKKRHCLLGKKLYLYNALFFMSQKERKQIVNSVTDYTDVIALAKKHKANV